MAVALYCWVLPFGMEGLSGVTTIETSCALRTPKVARPVWPPWVAEMIVDPTATLVAKPAALIVAVAGVSEDQTAVVVMSWVVASENVATAVNCWFTPSGTLLLDGVTVMSKIVTLFT